MISIFNKPYLAILATLVLFALVSMPSANLESVGSVNDKFAHFLSFFILIILWLLVSKNSKKVAFWLVIFAGFIEIWQEFILPNSFRRGGDIYDFYADCLGLLFGFFTFKLINYAFKF